MNKVLTIEYGKNPQIKIYKNNISKIEEYKVGDKIISKRLGITPTKYPVSFKYEHNKKLVCEEVTNINQEILDFYLLDKKGTQFKLWDNKYCDYIFPGETWEIDLESSAMAKKHIIFKNYVVEDKILEINLQINFNDIKKIFTKKYIKYIIDLINDNPKKKIIHFNIMTQLNNLDDQYISYIYTNVLPLFFFKVSSVIDRKDILYIDYDLKELEYIEETSNDKILSVGIDEISKEELILQVKDHEDLIFNYMLYAKTDPYKIFFTPSKTMSMYLMGILKRGDINMLVPCGVALWEDYYFNPIYYNTIKLENDIVHLTNIPNKNILKLNDFLIKKLKMES